MNDDVQRVDSKRRHAMLNPVDPAVGHPRYGDRVTTTSDPNKMF
jgi:hypothetical protein